MNLSKREYELVAKNNFVVAKLLATIVAAATMFNLPTDVMIGALLIIAAVFSTVSTYAWMSR